MNNFFNISLYHYLFLAFVLFVIGLLGVLINRNILRIVLSLSVMMVSVILSFLAFGFYCSKTTEDINMVNFIILTFGFLQTVFTLIALYKLYRVNEKLDTEKFIDEDI